MMDISAVIFFNVIYLSNMSLHVVDVLSAYMDGNRIHGLYGFHPLGCYQDDLGLLLSIFIL